MCNYIKLIARTEHPMRYIARCEHGTLHVVWNNAAYYLNRESLNEFRQVLERSDLMHRLRQQASGGEDASLEGIEIWFQDAGLRLRPHDFQAMCAMVDEALAFLAHAQSPTPSTLQEMLSPFSDWDVLWRTARLN